MTAGQVEEHGLMNPYRDRKLAGRAIRLVSTGIDFVLLLTLHFALCSTHLETELADFCGLVPFLLLVVYEVGLGTSAGKQLLGLTVRFDRPEFYHRITRAALKYFCIPFLVYPSMLFTARRQGLHEKAAGSVVLQPFGLSTWVRAVLGVVLATYAMLTFGCGQLIGTLAQERYDWELVSSEPESWIPEEAPSTRSRRFWLQGASFELPGELSDWRLRATPFLYFYSPSLGKSLEGSRVVVLPGAESHPFGELCRRESPPLTWILACELSPREFQSSIFEATMENRWFLNPRMLLREHANRFAKSSLLEGDELLVFRSYDSPEFSTVWHAVARFDEEGNIRQIADYVNVGGDEDDEHFGITIVWSGVERDETTIASLVASFRFDRGTEELAASLFDEGRRRRSPLTLLNALELAADKLPPAEALYEIYAHEELGFEKRQFASWVALQVEEGDLRFMDLNERVWDWRAFENEEP